MFSYRHAFHAGNHADVLKHTVLIAIARYMAEKDVGMTIIDTHAGAGLYQLDDRFAKTSGEAIEGYAKLVTAMEAETNKKSAGLAPLHDYIELVKTFAVEGNYAAYPGSPFILSRLLRAHDKLRLFELHPTDADLLIANVSALQASRKILPRQVAAFKENGFAGLKRLIPPPTRRALVLCDPSYELKEDYGLVVDMLTDSLKRFSTATFMIWFPVLARREAQDLPRQLQQVCEKAGKDFLCASLQVKDFSNAAPRYSREGNAPSSRAGSRPDASIEPKAAGLAASAVFVVNPPYTLKPLLVNTLPKLVEMLRVDAHAGWTLD
jgi:23S rRNA (adenine2030-N6)-methyltransferase